MRAGSIRNEGGAVPASLRRIGRDAFASFVGVGRGIWLFPLDTMFRTVGLKYGWLMTLFTVTPPPLLRTISKLRAEPHTNLKPGANSLKYWHFHDTGGPATETSSP